MTILLKFTTLKNLPETKEKVPGFRCSSWGWQGYPWRVQVFPYDANANESVQFAIPQPEQNRRILGGDCHPEKGEKNIPSYLNHWRCTSGFLKKLNGWYYFPVFPINLPRLEIWLTTTTESTQDAPQSQLSPHLSLASKPKSSMWCTSQKDRSLGEIYGTHCSSWWRKWWS